ncbi:MAG: peptidylprolyl isomerase [Bdellovibrionota bacterium]
MKLSLILCVFYSLFSVLFNTTLAAKELVDKVVVSVNDEIILLSELKNMQARASKPGAIDETLLLGESVSALKKDKKAQLNFLINEKLVDSEVKRLGMTSPGEQVDAELAQMAKKNKMSMSELSSYVANQGYTMAEYKNILKARSERQVFFEKEIVNKLRISDEDAYGVFRAKYPNYRPSVAEFKIAQIFFSNKKGESEGVWGRAEAALNKLAAGESFETLANQLDETPGSNKDGVLGVFKSGEFLPQIENAIGDLSVDAVSGILKGPNGFHIVKLLAKKTVLDPNFLRVKESIKASLVQQNFERQLKNWFELKKLEANIKTYDEAL